jgi:hypothetical protein
MLIHLLIDLNEGLVTQLLVAHFFLAERFSWRTYVDRAFTDVFFFFFFFFNIKIFVSLLLNLFLILISSFSFFLQALCAWVTRLIEGHEDPWMDYKGSLTKSINDDWCPQWLGFPECL